MIVDSTGKGCGSSTNTLVENVTNHQSQDSEALPYLVSLCHQANNAPAKADDFTDVSHGF